MKFLPLDKLVFCHLCNVSLTEAPWEAVVESRIVGVGLDPAERVDVWAICVVSESENGHSSPAGLLQRCRYFYYSGELFFFKER